MIFYIWLGLSVITITRNNIKGLKATYDSVAAQTCSDYEFIIIDGASNDGTADFFKFRHQVFLIMLSAGSVD